MIIGWYFAIDTRSKDMSCQVLENNLQTDILTIHKK